MKKTWSDKLIERGRAGYKLKDYDVAMANFVEFNKKFQQKRFIEKQINMHEASLVALKKYYETL